MYIKLPDKVNTILKLILSPFSVTRRIIVPPYGSFTAD